MTKAKNIQVRPHKEWEEKQVGGEFIEKKEVYLR